MKKESINRSNPSLYDGSMGQCSLSVEREFYEGWAWRQHRRLKAFRTGSTNSPCTSLQMTINFATNSGGPIVESLFEIQQISFV